MNDKICRSEINEDDEDLSKEEIFAYNFYSLNIFPSALPTYTKTGITYVEQKPSFIVAWIKDYFKR